MPFPPMAEKGEWAVALSGGPDSLALAAVLAEQDKTGLALIVDHGLRPESAQEARHVAECAQALGLKTDILCWQGQKPTTGLMNAAREARYRLLLSACRAQARRQLFIAHHLDDQIETALFRLARGSGWRGMAGMPDWAVRGGVELHRPFLTLPKSDLLAYCEARKLDYVTDPSNTNPRFQRARLRLSGCLSALGFDALSIAESLQVWRARRQAELEVLRAQCPLIWRSEPVGGYVQINADALPDMSPTLQRELLLNLAQTVGQARYRTAETIMQPRAGWTVMGCRFVRQEGRIFIAREAAATEVMSLPTGTHQVYWDKRFDVTVTVEQPSILAALGEQGSWRKCEGAEWLADLPGFVRASMPAVWRDGQLISVPKPSWRPLYQPLSQIFLQS